MDWSVQSLRVKIDQHILNLLFREVSKKRKIKLNQQRLK